MPILFVVKRSRKPLFLALKRLVEKPGLVGVLLERRRVERRRRRQRIGFDDRRSVSFRQPLDADGARTWAGLGFVVLKVHALPDVSGPAPRAARSTPDRSPRGPRSAGRPAPPRRTR